MKYTRTDIIREVNNENKNYFQEIYDRLQVYEGRDDLQKEVEQAYYVCYGDGNEFIICLNFKELNLYVQLRGTYSSWYEPHWDTVSFDKPYEYIETRYEDISNSDIRDSQIDEVLGDGNNDTK